MNQRAFKRFLEISGCLLIFFFGLIPNRSAGSELLPKVTDKASVDCWGGEMNPIPDNTPAGFTVDMLLNNVQDFPVIDLDVELHVLHPYVGDLKVVLTHVDSGRTAVLIDRPGRGDTGSGCTSNNIHVILDDEGTGGPI